MKINKMNAVIATLAMICCACEDFVSVEAPHTQLSGELVFEDARTAEAVLVTAYAKMQANTLVTGDTGGISVLLGNYADELDCYSPNIPELLFSQNNLQADNATVQTLWRNTYNVIYTANKVIEGVGRSAAMAQADRERLIGEALFLRAYLHFYLNMLFGEIPYVASTDYRLNTVIAKQPDTAIFLLIEQDLLLSETLLTDNYTGMYRTRPNRSTVLALQARFYLYHKKWELAKEKADSVLNNSVLYSLGTDINAVFSRNSSGTIWQLMSAPEGKNTLDAKSFIFTAVPPPARALREALVDVFEPQDLRRINWIKPVTNGTDTFYHAYKYKYNNDTSTSMEYSIQFRIEEQYLIRAEASAQLHQLGESAADLNAIRSRAGLAATSASSREGLLAAILEERRLELFTELGHRFFDLKRNGLLDAALQGQKPGWNPTDILFPLPENELLLNPNLSPQNQGY